MATNDNFDDLNIELSKLYEIEELLTGQKSKPATESDIIKKQIEKALKECRDLIDERATLSAGKTKPPVSKMVKLSNNIKVQLSKCEFLINQFEEMLKSKPQNDSESLQRIHLSFSAILSKLKEASLDVVPGASSSRDDFDKIDFQARNDNNSPNEITEIEQETLIRWKQKDAEIDNLLDDVIRSLDLLDQKVDVAGAQIKANQQQTTDLIKTAEDLEKDFDSANKRMKKLVKNFRAPSKLCMDACLIILIVVLVIILFKQLI